MFLYSLFLFVVVVRGEEEAMSAKELTEANFKDEVSPSHCFPIEKAVRTRFSAYDSLSYNLNR